jgi:hypothetical protein
VYAGCADELRRLRMHQNSRPPIMASAAIPPTTPPAMAPVLDPLPPLDDPLVLVGVGVLLVTVLMTTLAEADLLKVADWPMLDALLGREDAVEAWEAVDSGASTRRVRGYAGITIKLNVLESALAATGSHIPSLGKSR